MTSASSAAGGDRLHALLFPVGSAGDVYPFIALGRELARRGHRVTAFTSGYFRPEFDRCDVPLVDVFAAEEFLAAIREPGLWRAGLTALRHLARLTTAHVRAQYELVATHRFEPGAVVIAGTLAMGTRVAQDKLGVPTVTVALAPSMFPSVARPPRLPGVFMPDWLPAWLKRAQYRLADRVIDRLFADLNHFRAELDLPPVRRMLTHWANSPALTIALFPPWFAEPAEDWPPQVRLTNFPLFDQVRDAQDGGLVPVTRPGDGDPDPIVFTPGSAMLYACDFFQVAIEACRRLGRPGLMLTRFRDQLPSTLPPFVRHVSYAPLSRLLPHAAAVVHHGGIGTLSQGLAAGVPQLVMPMAHDQLDNAERLERLGVGRTLSKRRFRASAVARLLAEMLGDVDLRRRCRSIAARCEESDGVTAACDLIEGVRDQAASAEVMASARAR